MIIINPPAGYLEELGLFTHKVTLTTPEQVDDELIGWIREAYAGEF